MEDTPRRLPTKDEEVWGDASQQSATATTGTGTAGHRLSTYDSVVLSVPGMSTLSDEAEKVEELEGTDAAVHPSMGPMWRRVLGLLQSTLGGVDTPAQLRVQAALDDPDTSLHELKNCVILLRNACLVSNTMNRLRLLQKKYERNIMSSIMRAAAVETREKLMQKWFAVNESLSEDNANADDVNAIAKELDALLTFADVDAGHADRQWTKLGSSLDNTTAKIRALTSAQDIIGVVCADLTLESSYLGAGSPARALESIYRQLQEVLNDMQTPGVFSKLTKRLPLPDNEEADLACSKLVKPQPGDGSQVKVLTFDFVGLQRFPWQPSTTLYVETTHEQLKKFRFPKDVPAFDAGIVASPDTIKYFFNLPRFYSSTCRGAWFVVQKGNTVSYLDKGKWFVYASAKNVKTAVVDKESMETQAAALVEKYRED